MKRRVILLLLLLVAGAILNVVVASAICLLERQLVYNSGEASALLSDGSVLRVVRYDSSFTTLCTIVRGYSESQPPGLMNFDGDPFRLAPSWARASVDAPTPQFTSAREQYTWVSDRLTVVGVGWPFRAGGYSASHSVYAGPTYLLVYQSNRPAAGPMFSSGSYYGLMRFQRALPTRVIWPGFVLNSVLFAAVLWLLVIVNPRLRRRWRIRRGLCPRCAYDLRGSEDTEKCPECGAAIPSSASPTAHDWRLGGQEQYLMDATLTWRSWRQTRPHWDHDHCAFCWATFDAPDSPNLHEGYADTDEYHWVCDTCARDFAERFRFRLVGGPHAREP